MSEQPHVNPPVAVDSLPDPVRQVVGCHAGEGLRCALVVSRFNQACTSLLAENAVAALLAHGVKHEDILVVWVPGAYEIPAVLAELMDRQDMDVGIALGVVIQGETQHAQLINQHIALALGQLGMQKRRPVVYEVISAQTPGQARARCEGGSSSRGWYAGLAALETAEVFRQLRSLS